MSTENKDVAKYYDEFKTHQKNLGINLRHRTIFKNVLNAGLQQNSTVLEIGCGIGTVSHLMLKHLAHGRFVGVDISPESIAHAKQFNANYKNAEFIVSDMSDFKHDLKVDFVVFPDVLEHIPVEQHGALFKTIAAHSHENTVVVINIPEPYTLDWTRRNHPDRLQIIDQSLSMRDLCNNVYPHGFYMYSVTPYGLQYEHEEYLAIVLKRDKPRVSVTRRSKLAQGIENWISKF